MVEYSRQSQIENYHLSSTSDTTLIHLEEKKHCFSWRKYATGKIFRDINNTIRRFIRCRFKHKRDYNTWSEMVIVMEGYKPTYSLKFFKWIPPPPKFASSKEILIVLLKAILDLVQQPSAKDIF